MLEDKMSMGESFIVTPDVFDLGVGHELDPASELYGQSFMIVETTDSDDENMALAITKESLAKFMDFILRRGKELSGPSNDS